jgi:hypothetical protein
MELPLVPAGAPGLLGTLPHLAVQRLRHGRLGTWQP